MLALFTIAAAFADCPDDVGDEDVREALTEARQAYVDFDLDTFAERIATARSWVTCLDEVLDVGTAASVHRWVGLEAFGRRDLKVAELHFGTARVLEPAFSFGVEVVPAGSPITQHYLAVSPAPSGRVELVEPAPAVEVFVDGAPADALASDLPHVFQVVRQEGVSTVWLDAGDPLPSYPTPLEPPKPKKARRTGWFVGAAVPGVGAVTMQGVGLARRNAIVNDEARDATDRFDALKPNARLFNGLTVGLGVVAGGLLSVGLFARPALPDA